MGIALKNKIIDKYFGFLNNLDSSSKKRLILKLMESMDVRDKITLDLKSLCGSWEDSRTSDEIILEIKKARVEKQSSINLE